MAIIWCKREARGGTTVQRVRVHVGVIGFVGLSLTLGPGLHDQGFAAPRAETVANADAIVTTSDSLAATWTVTLSG